MSLIDTFLFNHSARCSACGSAITADSDVHMRGSVVRCEACDPVPVSDAVARSSRVRPPAFWRGVFLRGGGAGAAGAAIDEPDRHRAMDNSSSSESAGVAAPATYPGR